MTGTKPDIRLNDTFIQRQACEILGVSSKTFRTYERTGEIVRIATPGKYAKYYGRDIIKLWKAYNSNS